MRLRATTLLAFIGLLAAPSAFADTFTFTAAGTNFAASGTLMGTNDPYDSTAFDIQSGTATINGAAYTIYTPSGDSNNPQTVIFPVVPDGGYAYDNVLYTTGMAVDSKGLLFAGTADHYNLFFNNGSISQTDDFHANGTPVSFAAIDTTAATPEPSGIVLLGTGLLGLLGAAKSRLV